VLNDPKAWEVHFSFLQPPGQPKDPFQQNHLEHLGLKVRHHGPDALAPQERRELLLDPESLLKLRELVCS
jgi:hypothetical protein